MLFMTLIQNDLRLIPVISHLTGDQKEGKLSSVHVTDVALATPRTSFVHVGDIP